jgi:hypothetical protein
VSMVKSAKTLKVSPGWRLLAVSRLYTFANDMGSYRQPSSRHSNFHDAGGAALPVRLD